MAETTTDASVVLWDRVVAAASWVHEDGFAVFQYDPEFANSGFQLSPLVMPLSPEPYSFPALPKNTFKGLPGLLADALPDKYGERLVNVWLAAQRRAPESFNPVERLCYTGRRGMGALEFRPTIGAHPSKSKIVEVANLVRLANLALDEKRSLQGVLGGNDDLAAIDDILRVGTSAGGARAKAILAWNPNTGEFRHGQTDVGVGFEHWLMKLDGIENNRDKDKPDPQGYGLIEYAYFLMAKDAGIEMMPCQLHEEGGRSHFMTRRFDRPAGKDGKTSKLHMQSLCALQHYDFNDPRGYSYEQAILTIRQLGLGALTLEQQFLRAVFNVVARNQDDHVKNIAFLMDRDGAWKLSPAFDVTYSYNPSAYWTGRHQMSLNAKRDDFELQDLFAFAETASIKKSKAKTLISSVRDAVADWARYAAQAGLDENTARRIAKAHRCNL